MTRRSDLPCFLSPGFLAGCWLWGILNSIVSLVPTAEGAVSELWKLERDYRMLSLSVPAEGREGFVQVMPETSGITFSNQLAETRALTNQIFLNGSGVAAGDVDGDGRCDLYWCGLDGPNALYRNLGGWRFEEVTDKAGVACADQASTGAAFADVDGDGDLDLLVNGIARGTRLFLNDGVGHFREATAESGLQSNRGSTSLALADVNGDGRLDVYVVNYRSDTMRDMPEIQFDVRRTNGLFQLLAVNRKPATDPDLVGRFTFDQASGVLENGEADQLFLNEGGGRFRAVSWTDGLFLDESGDRASIPYDWGLSAMFHDLNGDGWPDLYVCNDFQSPDRVWINDGQGRFRALAREAIRQTSLFSMGVDVADLDRDGRDDLFVADMLSPDHVRRQVQVMDAMAFGQVRASQGDRPQSPRNTVLWNRGNGTYAEVAHLCGLEASDWSWCPLFLDVDLDGFEDLLLTTGHGRDAQHADVAKEIDDLKKQRPMSFLEELQLRRRFPVLDTPNVAFRNRGDLRFEPHGTAWGFDSRQLSHGMAAADLDGDGDLDVVVNCLGSSPLIYRNDTTRPRVAIRLRGTHGNTHGIGARIQASVPGLPVQSQEMRGGGRYMSSDDLIRTFAAGSASNRVALEVRWPGGRITQLTNLPVNCLYEIREPSGASADTLGGRAVAKVQPGLFEDLSSSLKHLHVDEPTDDYAIQSLLPRRLSDLGPGVAWFDFNGDGWEDLLVGGGKGGRLGVFRNDGKGQFIRQRAKPLEAPLDRDLNVVLGWQPNETNRALLLGLANEAVGSGPRSGLREFSVVTGEFRDDAWRSEQSTGPMALADVDGDGDLDLFIGSRCIPGQYPAPATSGMLLNHDGQWRVDSVRSHFLDRIGLVSGALFSDLDTNGRPDLVIACDWGSIRLLASTGSGWKHLDPELVWRQVPSPIPPPRRLSAFTGWWTSLAAGDFDADGRPDLVMGNWGRNHFRNRFSAHPTTLSYGDSSGNGTFALLESHVDDGLGRSVPALDLGSLRREFPSLQESFPTFAAMSRAGLAEVLSAGLPELASVSAASFDSVVLLNRGDSFEVRPLPVLAQVSPVFGIGVGDFDGDGCQDLLLSQNTFGTRPGESRQDAGAGLWLKGAGDGTFSAVGADRSGLLILGEGRGVASCDFDHDGRLDAVVGQHQGATRLLRNQLALAGLRLQLQGGPGNRQAIGTSVRPIYFNGEQGPLQEVRLGNGSGSQDGTTLLLARPTELSAVWIRWPNGRTEEVPVTKGSMNLSRFQPGIRE
ncbi:MAG: VCBS repeat-containing protein [Verrucomicrobiales bacterium]|nr:VCBS repeat-containing protein [Verrucomicrobiales bacterium]